MRLATALASALFCLSLPAAAQDANKPVRLGVMENMAGATAYLNGPGSVEAAKMAVEDFGGKVLGRPIEVLAADHQDKPAVGALIARRWFDENGVDIILDVPTSDVALAVNRIVAEKKKLAIFVGGVTDQLVEQECTGYGLQWGLNTYADAQVVVPMIKSGSDSFFFVTSDYVFGHTLESSARAAILKHGGKVLGSVSVPLETTDYASFLLQAQASGAKVIALLISGGDRLVTAFKEAREFGLSDAQHKVTSLHIYSNDVNILGLEQTQGLQAIVAYDWDRDDASRAFAKRFQARMHAMPSENHAGVYSATLTYLKAVQLAGSTDTDKVRQALQTMKIDDFYARNSTLLANGRLAHDMYIVQVKSPAESKYPWDYFKILATLPGDQAFLPMTESKCPLVKH
ncbi:MAG: ABC transporter substrate-binding protein [Nevskiales bacterium]